MSPIETKTRDCVKQMEKCCLEMPWEDRAVYADWLAQTYFYVRHATRVLAKAAYKCRLEEEPLHKQLLKGINEEKNHEIMAINDLGQIDFKIGQFTEYPETSAYYQTLYHLLDYNGPFELLGYFVTLEGLGAIGSDKIYDRIVSTHGEKASTFIKVHAKLDAGHFEEGIQLIQSLAPAQLAVVNHGLDISTTLYCNMIKKIVAQAAVKLKAA